MLYLLEGVLFPVVSLTALSFVAATLRGCLHDPTYPGRDTKCDDLDVLK